MKHFYRVLTVSIISILLFFQCGKQKDLDQMVIDFFNDKKEVTILVTDSGLGGLSVAADVAAKLPASGIFEKVHLVFFNSLFHNKSGYNSLKSEEEKVRIFQTALQAMKKKYRPDLLLIACNTLSVLYDKTTFSKQARFPVIGIVETGVDLIAERFDEKPESIAIIFATKTTIESEAHKKMLIHRGYPGERIIGQACHRLAGAIERGYNSEETIGYINKYVDEALEKVKDASTPFFVSFNCTHYGYAVQQFEDAFFERGYSNVEFIDPNPEMSNFLFTPKYLNRFPETKVTVEVVSKTNITEQEIGSISTLLQMVSPQTAEALRHYRYEPELFDAKFDTTMIGK